MKRISYILIISCSLLLTGCSDWLDILPKNEQVTDNFWKSKEDVEAVVISGYYNMRQASEELIDWGELRGASVYYFGGTGSQMTKLQNFQLIPADPISDWATIYKVINMANSVIKYAPGVRENDPTYSEGAMYSHLTEAYFMRALMNFYLVRNYKEAPLILEPYVTDKAPFSIAKSNEEEIMAQIKTDILTAINSNAAKEFFVNEEWAGASKGRATIWALYALMAETSLWSENYAESIKYADFLINATAPRRPAFMATPSQWFSIFNPGNSNESIFELNWDGTTYNQTSGSPSNYFTIAANASRQFSETMMARLMAEDEEIAASGNETVRSLFGAYIPVGEDDELAAGCIWKYRGTEVQDKDVMRINSDANWIIYRMADILLIKAESLIWKDESGWQEAVDIINKIRFRSNLNAIEVNLSEMDEESMLDLVLYERDIELAAEGKRWYDLVRFGKSKDYKYKNSFITIITDNNATANDSWIRSVLKNNYAWYLPIYERELEVNTLLTQNPYYGVTTEKN
ncbi:MAG TPA: RagB/SusD family nutrient uptake outer membrane protein [Clostridiales bacterium]|nr:RagB/SusD family nutrient uptake outer membrane protein [Clostridiales bacterium]